MTDRAQGGDPVKRGSPSGWPITVLAIAIKGVCGVLLAVLVLQSWNQVDELGQRQDVVDDWSGTQDFAVFFPHANGNDLAEVESGGHATKAAEAGELYSALEKDGALFVDAGNYAPGIPESPDSRLPAPPIRVNSNYLDHYPIEGASGTPIEVDRDEQAWVVAVPDKFKDQEAEIEEFFRAARSGSQGVDGAVQAQEEMLGKPVPDRVRDQEVRIIWTASDQELFTFDSRIAPEAGNVVADPIVEIMTPANSITIDRLNAITGEIDTPLKVRVDGDPQAELRSLAPKLEELDLDDNLQHLVTQNEAMVQELSEIRRGIASTTAAAGAALGVMLVFSAVLVAVLCDRLRRTLIVRRLHGFGFMRTYRELFLLLGATCLGQALVAGVLVVLRGMSSGPPGSVSGGLFADIPQLLAVLVAASGIEAIFAALMAVALERRNAAKRLKEL